jgi:GntR family transcriptional regulator
VLGALEPGDVPVFRQIAEQLRSAIRRGELRPGDRLPSEQQLMDHYGTARMTVREALGVLKGEGLVVAEHGRGVFVRPQPQMRRLGSDRFARRHRRQGKAAFIADAEAGGQRAEVDQLEVREEKPPADVLERLGLRKGSSVVVRRRRYLVDGFPVEHATSYIPLELARGTLIAQPDTGPGGLYARLEERGVKLKRFREEVDARMPTPEEARRLSLPPGVPVLHLVRTAEDVDGRAVEVCDTVMAANSFLLDYELPAR